MSESECSDDQMLDIQSISSEEEVIEDDPAEVSKQIYHYIVG